MKDPSKCPRCGIEVGDEIYVYRTDDREDTYTGEVQKIWHASSDNTERALSVRSRGKWRKEVSESTLTCSCPCFYKSGIFMGFWKMEIKRKRSPQLELFGKEVACDGP